MDYDCVQVSSGPIYSVGTRFPIESGRVSLRERGIHTFEIHKISTFPDPLSWVGNLVLRDWSWEGVPTFCNLHL